MVISSNVRAFARSWGCNSRSPVWDILRGKVWAAPDPTRRASKRQKDLADIARLLEAYPALRAQVPPDLLDRLV
jgi:hypothetical protein